MNTHSKRLVKKETEMRCHKAKIEELEEMRKLKEYVERMTLHSCNKDPILKVIDFELSMVEGAVYTGLGEIYYKELMEKKNGKN